MLRPIYLKGFERDIARDKKSGKDVSKLRKIMDKLIKEEPLPRKNFNHKLKGDFEGYWECHIEPNWLLIYKKTRREIIFAKTGSHSDLYRFQLKVRKIFASDSSLTAMIAMAF